MSGTRAPQAPGSIGERIAPEELSAYLADLDTWIHERKRELDELDAAALASPLRDRLTADMTLSMALWKAASDRQRLLAATWDGGRVGPQQRERMSTLIWGRLDGTLDQRTVDRSSVPASSLALSLPEACRLLDALASQLRVRLSLDPAADAYARRVREVRAQVERLRDQIALEPSPSKRAAQEVWDSLHTRVEDLATRAGRGADIGGLIGPLENEAAVFERDLIVGGSRRREAIDQARALAELQADLEAREDALAALAAKTRATVTPAPRYAVPDVSALGPVPRNVEQLVTFRARLERVTAAMNLVEDAFSAALAEHEELSGRLAAAQTWGAGLLDERARRTFELAAEVLALTPAPLKVAEPLVRACEGWLPAGGERKERS